MVKLNKVYPRDEEKSNKLAKEYLDLVFSHIPEFDDFDISQVIKRSNLDETKKMSALRVSEQIKRLLLGNGFASHTSMPSYLIRLTDLGREVKDSGGYHNYTQKRDEAKRMADESRKQEMEKMKIDIAHLKRQNASYWVNWVLMGISIVISMISLVIACNK